MGISPADTGQGGPMNMTKTETSKIIRAVARDIISGRL